MAKAQAAVEMMVLAAILLLVLFLLFEFGENRLIESASILQVSQARNAVDTLAKAATDVCNEGVGARKKIYVTIPDRVNPSRILIGNKTITLGVYAGNGTSDVSSIVNCPVAQGGFFPTTPGSYWVWVISRTGYVQVGSAVDVEPLNEYFELFPTNSTSTNVTFTNYGASTINVSSTLTWTDSEVNVTINGTNSLSFSLISGTSAAPLLNINATANTNATRGLHYGYITISTNLSDSETIPVVVNIVSSNSSPVSYMAINTYNNSYTTPSVYFHQAQVIYYQVKSYNSSNGPVNSTVVVRIYSPLLAIMNENIFNSPNNGTGVYNGNYTLSAAPLSGLWSVKAYEVNGTSAVVSIWVTGACDTACTFGGLGVCNSSCSGSCSNWRAACNTLAPSSQTCSNSTGGTSGAATYYVSCCNGAITSCSTNSTPCNPACNGTYQNCNYPSNPATCSRTCNSTTITCQDCTPSCGSATCASCSTNSTACNPTCNGTYQNCSYASNPATCNRTCSGGSCSDCSPSCGSSSCVSCGTSSCPSNYCSDGYTSCTYPATCNISCSGGSCTSCSCSATCGGCGTESCPSGYCYYNGPWYWWYYSASTCSKTCSGGSCQSCSCSPISYINCGTTACQASYCSGGTLYTYPATCDNSCAWPGGCGSCSCSATTSSCAAGYCCSSTTCCTCGGGTSGTCLGGETCCNCATYCGGPAYYTCLPTGHCGATSCGC